MKDARDIIESLGGTGSLAKKLGVRPQVVCNWAGRRAIPWPFHSDILRLAADADISLTRSDLERIARPKRAA